MGLGDFVQAGLVMNRARIRSLPTFADQMKAFANIDAILARLEEGWIHAERGEPVFFDRPSGKWCDIPSNLAGWIEFWERLSKHYGLGIDMLPLAKLANKLRVGVLITPEEVQTCIEIVKACKRAYRKMDVSDVHSIVRTQLIANRVDEMGIVGEQA